MNKNAKKMWSKEVIVTTDDNIVMESSTAHPRATAQDHESWQILQWPRDLQCFERLEKEHHRIRDPDGNDW
jgi:hypothetical protein